MKISVIRLDRIDELLNDYKTFKNEGESFSGFIQLSKCLFDDDQKPLFDWEEVLEENLIEVREE